MVTEGDEGRRTTLPEGGVSFWAQTGILVQKNWKCKWRTDKKKLAGEILVPVVYLCLLSFIVSLQPNTKYDSQEQPDSVAVDVMKGFADIRMPISVYPETKDTRAICELISEMWMRWGKSNVSFEFYQTLKELETLHFNETAKGDMALVFDLNVQRNTTSFSYTIMTTPGGLWSTPPTSQRKAELDTCRGNPDSMKLQMPSTCPVNGYFYSGFLGLQYLTDQALLKYSGHNLSNESEPSANWFDIEIQNYPKLAYTAGMSTTLRFLIPFYALIPMAQIINNLLVMIVTEKEDRIKDGFRMIGVSDGAYWLSWFVVYSGILGFLSVMFTLVMHFTNVLRNINAIILFLIFFLFGLSVITFAFALTPFFHVPKTAGIVGTLIMQFWGMLFLIQVFVETSSDAYLFPLRFISSLAFTSALDQACVYEYQGGINFSDLHPSGRGSKILYSLIFICFDTILYGLIALYLDNVIPNEYGARKHPFFCFKSCYWKGDEASGHGYRRSSLSQDNVESHQDDDGNVERVASSMIGKEAIQIRNVHKTYSSLFSSKKVEAVKGISLDIYEGQITAILGKNGAGKSTLFSIITGLVPPSKGFCNVFGLNTNDPEDMNKLRKITGVCLQKDLLFAALTVEEHLELYGKLRGLRGVALSNDIRLLLKELMLTEKASTSSKDLSGGQKRKLSVAIALIGDPKIILLDEPSAGVDPVSRRHLWALLKQRKEGRVIMLTTHFLDEADFLADRKAIIHDGVLKAHGSSLFLKNKFGVGYHLTVEAEGEFDVKQCDMVVEKWLPQAIPSRQIIGKEIKYCLPHSEIHVFAQLFSDLENLTNSNSPFKSCGVSMTTLEEVFLKISNDAWEEQRLGENGSEESGGRGTDINEECNLIEDLPEIKISFAESLWVLCLLRIRRLFRSPQSLFFMIVMPSILLSSGFGLMKAQSIIAQENPLSFDDPKVAYSDPDQRRLAFSGNDTESAALKTFLREKGFTVLNYSGSYSELLRLNEPEKGTMAAVAINNGTTNLRINGTFLHGPPLLLNMLSQFIWRKSSNSTIKATVQPFAPKKSAFNPNMLYLAMFIGPSFTFVAVGLVLELVKDREIGARDHLRVNGVSFLLYFLSMIIVYGILSVIITCMQIGLIAVFQVASFGTMYPFIVTVILLLLFIPSCLLFSTIFSYWFDKLDSAQSIFSTVSYWAGLLAGIIVFILDLVISPGNPTQYKGVVLSLHTVFSALDIFYIPFGVFYWVEKKFMICSVMNTCDQLTLSDYTGPEFIIMGVCLLVQIPVFSLLVVIVDVIHSHGSPMAAIRSIFSIKKRVDLSSSQMNIMNGHENEDGMEEDVQNEMVRVENIFDGENTTSNIVVAVKKLKKTYPPKRDFSEKCLCQKGKKGYEALKGISFAVEKGEVFGLLGHNGAGKSTAMRIIIAQESATSGRVRLCGQNVESSYSDAFLKLGYCAQHDPLWENITLREHLELYSVITGIPREIRRKQISQLLVGLQIHEHSDKKASQLSGGTKRKLSYGISMLGSPKIVLMDEPSTGMDPQSKRFLWNTILGSFKEFRGAILTTHSMEEAEVLCTRIAILKKGSLICIGSPQHLKSKYGQGYTLEIKLKSPDPKKNKNDNVSVRSRSGVSTVGSLPPDDKFEFVRENFPGCTATEIFNEKAVFSLPMSSVQSISKAFALLEKLKKEKNIEEYSFSQTTLEQIFLQFAKEE